MAAVTDMSGPPRVWLEPVRFHHALLDGSWWPGSGDLAAELPVLMPALERICGPVARLLLGVAGWASRPHEVVTDGRRVGVSYQAGQSPSLMTVLCVDGRAFTMFVLPAGPVETVPASRLG